MITQSAQTSAHQRTSLSQTQNAFQFPKTKRFVETLPQCSQAFYGVESLLSNRKAHIGYGEKSDFTKPLTVSPPSTKYRHKSVFENGKNGKTFACSRQKASPNDSYLMPQLYKNPGPGQYENQIHTRMQETFSLGHRTLDVFSNKTTNKHTPGPAAYQTNDLDKKLGKYFVSKYHDVKLATIDPYIERFPTVKIESPGPSNYKQQDMMANKTKYVLSNYQGHGNRPFDKQARFTLSQWKTDSNPGPGRYEIKSEFDMEKNRHSLHF